MDLIGSIYYPIQSPIQPSKVAHTPFRGVPKWLCDPNALNHSGWSNTQFSYWARRAEAISVLGQYDERLLSVGKALKHRLRGAATDTHEEHLDAQSITGKGLTSKNVL